MFITFSILFAFIDPFTVIPAFIIGWFVLVRSAAIVLSFFVALVIAFVMFELRVQLGDSDIKILPFGIKILVAMFITYLAHMWKAKRKIKQAALKDNTINKGEVND